jgi:hypothetical protein
MNYLKVCRIAWSTLLAVLLSTLALIPVSASVRAITTPATLRQTLSPSATSLDATFYLTTATLQPMFQSRIDQQVPGAMNAAMAGVVHNLPASDRVWAAQMASALIQPSATLTSLTPQQEGLAARVRLNLYPGDPKPINATLLVTFSVMNNTTVRVSARPLPNSPALVNGPLTTLRVPLGQLNAIGATPSCGDAALAVKLSVPVSLGQGGMAQTTAAMPSSSTQITLAQSRYQPLQPLQPLQTRQSPALATSYAEIPASSLSTLGGSIGSLSVSKNLSAQNIQVGVQGGQLVITSDIFLGTSLKLGTATTYVQPLAQNGGLAVHVMRTTLTIFSLFTFPYNTYNRQIEQTLNSKLNSAFAGKFYATNAAIGPNSHVPCAASNSLILTGTTSLSS